MANTAVFGIYSTQNQVESVVNEMRGISKYRRLGSVFRERGHERLRAREAYKGARRGDGRGTSGALLGGALGWLAGMGAIAIPGTGPFIAAGPIIGALSGMGAGAALGGLTGALIGMGVPEYEAVRYEGRVKGGNILLSVHADDSDWTKKAKLILERTGAEDIASMGETKGDYANTDQPKPRTIGT